MKAIICTQCGASIENVSEQSVIVDCEYCGARMIMDRGEPLAQPKPPAIDAPDFSVEVEPERDPQLFVKVAGGFIALIIFVIALVVILPKSKSSATSGVYNPPRPAASSSPYTWAAPINVEPAKPLPVVNYQPRISWDGPNDLEYFDDPEVDISSVSDLTSEEVKKTVFKNRVVKLKVVINTEGEIDDVKTISGHPLLVDAATASAKRSIFAPRSKPTTRVLTYTFRLLPD